jgi:hypothetical protein
LLFAFGHFDLHLSINHSEQSEEYTLLGQLFNREAQMVDLESTQIDLLADQQPIRTALTDTLGRFRLSNLRGGQYDLQITAERCATVLHALTLNG